MDKVTREDYEKLLHALKNTAVKMKAAIHLLKGSITEIDEAFRGLHKLNGKEKKNGDT